MKYKNRIYMNNDTYKKIRKKINRYSTYKSHSSIYALYFKSTIVYIGQTDNTRSRIIQHINSGDKLFDNFKIIKEKNSKKERRCEEKKLIGLIEPIYNIEHGTSSLSKICKFHALNNVKLRYMPLRSMSYLEANKTEIIKLYANGYRLSLLAEMYYSSANTIKKRLLAWKY